MKPIERDPSDGTPPTGANATAPLPPTPGGVPKTPWYKTKTTIILAAVIVMVLLVLFAHGHAPIAP